MPFSAMLAGNWRLLIMTDGVWKGISWNSLIATARNTPGSNISAILRKIVIGTSTLGLPDDFSIIFIEP
jgi:hypothetical protein